MTDEERFVMWVRSEWTETPADWSTKTICVAFKVHWVTWLAATEAALTPEIVPHDESYPGWPMRKCLSCGSLLGHGIKNHDLHTCIEMLRLSYDTLKRETESDDHTKQVEAIAIDNAVEAERESCITRAAAALDKTTLNPPQRHNVLRAIGKEKE